MFIKRLSILLLVVLFMTGFSACDSKDDKDTGAVNNKGNNTLKIYYSKYEEWEIPNILNTFKEKYKDVNVEDEYFPDVDEYKKKITMDILSGEGPDVIFINTMYFESINKLISSGVFCDLNELIRKDKDFKMADYNEKVLNAFEKDGKRLVIPLRYSTSVLKTSKEALQRNNIKIDPSNWTYEELAKIAEKHISGSKGDKKYFFSDFDIKDMVKGSRASFIDYKNKKSTFNSAGFTKILEIYKRLYPAICPEEEEESRSVDKLMKNDVFIMMPDLFASPASLYLSYSLYKSFGEEMAIYPFPVLEGENSSSFAYAQEAVAVNSRSKNKEAAFNFIKIMLSEESLGLKGKGFGNKSVVPVNKKAYESDFEYFTSAQKESSSASMDMGGERYNYSTVPLPKGYKTVLDNIFSKVDRCEIPEAEIFKMIKEEMPDFLEGKRTAAQTAKAIDDKVSLYLNE